VQDASSLGADLGLSTITTAPVELNLSNGQSHAVSGLGLAVGVKGRRLTLSDYVTMNEKQIWATSGTDQITLKAGNGQTVVDLHLYREGDKASFSKDFVDYNVYAQDPSSGKWGPVPVVGEFKVPKDGQQMKVVMIHSGLGDTRNVAVVLDVNGKDGKTFATARTFTVNLRDVDRPYVVD